MTTTSVFSLLGAAKGTDHRLHQGVLGHGAPRVHLRWGRFSWLHTVDNRCALCLPLTRDKWSAEPRGLSNHLTLVLKDGIPSGKRVGRDLALSADRQAFVGGEIAGGVLKWGVRWRLKRPA